MELSRGCSGMNRTESVKSTTAGPRNSGDVKQNVDETVKGGTSLGEERIKSHMV